MKRSIAVLLAATCAVAAPMAAAAAPAGGNAQVVRVMDHPSAVPAKGKPGTMARKYLGTPRSGHAWHSGAWTGEYMSARNATRWGTWRGTPSDATPTFPERRTWKQMRESDWHIQTYQGFRGTLVYGLPLLPSTSKPAELKAVAAGSQDATFRRIARDLRTQYKGGPVVVRIGWEANGDWMSFRTTYRTAGDYRAAFRRVAQVMKKEHPKLIIDFDINCGTPLPGQRHRLDSLTRLYPGDDVVDLIGCDTYDWDVLKATNDRQWRASLKPRNSVGIQDVADFARKRGKGLSFPEWGLTHAYDGNGDNPFYIRKMYEFFVANNDVLVLENYFNVPDQHMKNSIWDVKMQNPKASAEYRRLFGSPRR
ncbi:MAG: glycosyl hydrolase [Mobilicoccus sp.]|nr:glycosyl hydrolase [Mobilicoccus sp.]